MVTARWARRVVTATSTSGGVIGTGAFLALLLCVLGFHGLAALAAVHRGRELGVRSALGAGAVRLFGTFVRGLAPPGAAGAAAGAVVLSLLDRFLLDDLLSSEGAVVAGVVFLALMSVAVTGPALGAARIRPTRLLRGE